MEGGAERGEREERHILSQGQTPERTEERLTTLANIARAGECRLVPVDLQCAFWPSPVFHSAASNITV